MYIDQEKIFERTNGGLDVILQYYPDANKAVGKKNAKFKVREERTPSAALKLLEDGIYIVTDFGKDQSPRNAIQIVMLEEGCDFKTAINKIAIQYQIEGENQTVPEAKADFEKRDANPEEEEGTRTFITKDFTDNELKELFPAFSEKTKAKYIAICKRYHLFSCKEFTQIKDRKALTFKSNDSFPIFFFEIKQGEITHRKVYKPREPKKQFRFFWDNGRPKDYIFGLEQCKKDYEKLNAESKSDLTEEESEDFVMKRLPRIFIGSGDRDSLNLSYLETHVIWLNSETAELKEKDFLKLLGICKEVYNVPDLDNTGRRAGYEMAMQHIELKTVWLPNELQKKKDARGNACKDFTDFRKHFPYTKDWNVLVRKALKIQFWDQKQVKNNKGDFTHYKYELNNVQAYYFLKMNGFNRLKSENNKDGFIFIRKDANIISEIKINDIKSYIHSYLEKNDHDIQLRNSMFRTNQLNETSLANLNITEIDFNSSDKNLQYVFFKNKTLKVTNNEIEVFKRDNVEKFVWDSNVVDHEFSLLDNIFSITKEGEDYDITINNNEGIFLQYLNNTSRVHWKKEEYEKKKLDIEEIQEQKLHLINKIYTIGYMIHRYKDPSKAWCPFAMDNKISDEDESHGGSGKSIMFKAIRYMLQTITLDARSKKLFDNNHVFENVSEHTEYLLFDDANKYFAFDNLFSRITGDFSVNPKGTSGYQIPFDLAPKMAITTNYTPNKIDPSTERRLLYSVFSDYYHDNTSGDYQEARNPRIEFGMNLFTDFDVKQWNLFYNFMIQCLQVYLTYPKIDPPMFNVSKRNLLTIMGMPFQEWADIYFDDKFNDKISKPEAMNDFYESTKLYKWSSKKFTNSLRAWIKFNNYKLNPPEHSNDKGRIVSKIEGKTTEMYYIQNIDKPTGEGLVINEKQPF